MKAPLDTPVMAGFVAELDRINAIADATPGFVWRLADDDPADPALGVLGPLPLVNLSVWQELSGALGPLPRVNLSVWQDLSALRDYVYRSTHAEVFQRRGQWFEPLGQVNV